MEVPFFGRKVPQEPLSRLVEVYTDELADGLVSVRGEPLDAKLELAKQLQERRYVKQSRLSPLGQVVMKEALYLEPPHKRGKSMGKLLRRELLGLFGDS